MMHNPPHPGEILKEEVIAPLGLSVTEVAQRLSMSRVAVSRVSQRWWVLLTNRPKQQQAASVSLLKIGGSGQRLITSAPFFSILASTSLLLNSLSSHGSSCLPGRCLPRNGIWSMAVLIGIGLFFGAVPNDRLFWIPRKRFGATYAQIFGVSNRSGLLKCMGPQQAVGTARRLG